VSEIVFVPELQRREYTMVMRDPKVGFQIPSVKFEKSKKPLVSRAGLQGLLRIFDSTELGKRTCACLPVEGSNRAIGSYQLALCS